MSAPNLDGRRDSCGSGRPPRRGQPWVAPTLARSAENERSAGEALAGCSSAKRGSEDLDTGACAMDEQERSRPRRAQYRKARVAAVSVRWDDPALMGGPLC